MRYIRLKFSEEEFTKIKKKSDGANLAPNRYIQSIVLKKRDNPYYVYNLIIILLESIAEDINKNNYNSSTSKIFFYLYTIEQLLEEKL